MTIAQIDDLFIEWDLYDEKAKKRMVEEFWQTSDGDFSMNDFLEFLRDRLEIVGYWEKVGAHCRFHQI